MSGPLPAPAWDMHAPRLPALALATTAFAPALAIAQTSLGVFAPQTATMDLNTAWFTTQVEEKFGVDLNFETTGYDSSAAADQSPL